VCGRSTPRSQEQMPGRSNAFVSHRGGDGGSDSGIAAPDPSASVGMTVKRVEVVDQGWLGALAASTRRRSSCATCFRSFGQNS
jgi:hypothetical protein